MSTPIWIKTPGILLNLTETGESDLRLDAFTLEYGRLSALAKGGKRSKKRFFGLLLLAQELELNLRLTAKGGDLWLLESASLLQAHAGLRQDYRRFLAAMPVLELLLRSSGAWDPHPHIYELALASLERLEQAKTLPEMGSVVLVFLVRLLQETGHGLNLTTCLKCGKPLDKVQNPRLSLAGGLACRGHGLGAPEVELTLGLIKGLNRAADLDNSALKRLSFPLGQLRPGLAYLTRFWQEVLQHDLLSLGTLQRELGAKRAAG
jgi:DNA repair protein RecO (recombination protein O)